MPNMDVCPPVDERFQCAVCLDGVKRAHRVSACRHIFCKDCISQCTACPLCRGKLAALLPLPTLDHYLELDAATASSPGTLEEPLLAPRTETTADLSAMEGWRLQYRSFRRKARAGLPVKGAPGVFLATVSPGDVTSFTMVALPAPAEECKTAPAPSAPLKPKAAPKERPNINVEIPMAVIWALAVGATMASYLYGTEHPLRHNDGFLAVSLGWAVAMLACFEGSKAFVDRHVPREGLFWAIKALVGLEPVGVALVGIGVALDSFAVSFLGALLASQLSQIHRVQRKTTGEKAPTLSSRFFNTSAAYVHHFGSFLIVPNVATAVFLSLWRAISISGHAFEYLRNDLGFSEKAIVRLGCFRYVTTVLLAQPFVAYLAATAALGYALPEAFVQLRDGLVVNALGHASYMLFRMTRLASMALQLQDDPAVFDKVANRIGKTMPLLTLECTLLTAGAGLLLVAFLKHDACVALCLVCSA